MTDTPLRPFWRNVRLVVPCALLQSAGYALLNHYPLSPPRQLPMTVIDEGLPFWVWTVWPYLLLLALGPLLPLFIRGDLVFRRLFLAYVLAIPTTFAFFVFYPTAYPRPGVPLDCSLTATVYGWLIAIDTEGCCFPSGHIVVPVLFAFGVWLDGRRGGALLCGLVALLAPSVLTTKQHYLWDLLGALAIVACSLFVSFRVIRPPTPAAFTTG